MSSQLKAYPSSGRFETYGEAEKKSGNYAAVLTFGLVLAVNVFLLLPSSSTGVSVPKGEAPLTVEIRRVPPPPPPVEPVKEDTRKLLSEMPTPESFAVPEPPKPPKPVEPEPKKQPPPPKKPVAKPQPQKPAPAQTAQAAQVAEPATEPGPAAPTGPVGHASGETKTAPDTKGEILAALLHAVEQNKRYPRHARRAGIEGRVTIKVTIDASGRVTCMRHREGKRQENSGYRNP
ncbi:MAG: hypothetical protein DELT_00236 [Desulfovibrio sp.]